MGKTISLKLTDKEERIITRLNQEGITNSDLLRDALWQYFNAPDMPGIIKLEQHNENQILQAETKPVTQEYITQLQNEIHELRGQNIQLKQQIEDDIDRLYGHLSHMYVEMDVEQLHPNLEIKKSTYDIHHIIDDVIDRKIRRQLQ